MTSLTKEAVAPLGVKPRDADRSKNFFALGLISWLYSRPTEPTLEWIEKRFAKNAQVLRRPTGPPSSPASTSARRPSCSTTRSRSSRPRSTPGVYTNINGNTALAWGLVAASQLADLPLFLGSYPITPASDILHELSKHKNFGVRTFQAEDEIAAIGSALGAAFGGHLGVTTTSGPGVALKSETISLAVSLELPLLIIDIQRGGPSTGLPTKTEAADLNMALYGRHAEAPLPVVAAYSPSHCFEVAIEAARLALKYRTPVILLSDGYLANGSEPWKLPDVDTLPDISVAVRHRAQPRARRRHARVLALPARSRARWPARGPCPARPGCAPHRRHREGRRHGQHLLRARPTTRRWCTCGRPRSPASPTTSPRSTVTGDAGRRAARARLGQHVGRHRLGRRAGAAPGPQGGLGPPRPPQPAAGQPRRGAAAVPEDPRARAEPRPAVPAGAGRVPGRRPLGHEGAGRARSRPLEVETAILDALGVSSNGASHD